MSPDDPHAALNVDLDAPLDDSEFIPVATHRVVDDTPSTPPDGKKKKKKKEKGKKKKVVTGSSTVFSTL